MKDENKTKKQLISELKIVRQQIDALATSDIRHMKAEEELRQTKDHLDNVIESSLDCIVITDNKGIITRANKSFLNLLGFKNREVIGKHIAEFSPTKLGTYVSTTGDLVEIHQAFFNLRNNMILQLLNEGKISNWEIYNLRKDNKVVPTEQNIVYLYDKQGNITGAIGAIRDITARKKAERELRETTDFLENIFKTSVDGIMITDKEGSMIMVNEAIERILGYSKEEILGKGVGIFRPEGEEYKVATKKYLTKLFEENTVYGHEQNYLKKDGGLIDLEISSALLKDTKGTITGSVSSIRDITERKKSEKEIRETRDFLESVFENSMDGIIITDPRGYIISYNTALEIMSGYKREELIGAHISVFTNEDTTMSKEVSQEIEKLFAHGFGSYETIYKAKDAKLINIECNASMIMDDNGDYLAVVGIIRDITERKKIEQQLIQTEKIKSLGELAGGVAHDFNNILAAILGRVQLLRMSIDAPPEKREKRKSVASLKKGLEIVEKAAIDGSETVRRIQEFSKRGDSERFTALNINDAIDDALEFTKVRWKDTAESKNIKFNIKKEFSPLPLTAGNGPELRELFTNLISNSIDAMPQGGKIMLKTFIDNKKIVATIEDTGIGIPETIQERIFDPFFTTKGVQSTGLGLSVSYGIISRHRGTIVVESSKGKGAIFTVTLPLSNVKVPREKTEQNIQKKHEKVRILVIDDEKDVRELLYDILTGEGHKVEVASGGIKGIQLFKKKCFDLVFTDLGMPEMSGWQVAKEIKKINNMIPLALITGWKVQLKNSKLKESGVDLIMHKPFKVDQVLKLVQQGITIKKRLKKTFN